MILYWNYRNINNIKIKVFIYLTRVIIGYLINCISQIMEMIQIKGYMKITIKMVPIREIILPRIYVNSYLMCMINLIDTLPLNVRSRVKGAIN